jgi:hypothetical protein
VKNQSLYDATVTALTERGCPKDLAIDAAAVVAKDDPVKPDLGRTPVDQEIIKKSLPYLQNQ